MVTVSGYRVVETEDGEYIRLVLSGDLEMVRSETTGNYYATTKQATISATFDEHTAKKMIGKELPGTIERIEVEPYEIETDSGTIKLSHRWIYRQGNVEIPAKEETPAEKESSIIELAETAKKRKNGIDKIAV